MLGCRRGLWFFRFVPFGRQSGNRGRFRRNQQPHEERAQELFDVPGAGVQEARGFLVAASLREQTQGLLVAGR